MISTAGKLARSLNSPLGLALSLIPLFVLALFAHPQADDYIYAAQAEKLGFVGAQQYWYQQWCGRYFATLLQTGFPLAFQMTAAYALVPLTMLVATLGSIAWLTRASNRALGNALVPADLRACTIALATLYVSQMPGLCEGIYWLAGGATYQIALAGWLGLLACAVSVRQDTSQWGVALRAVVAMALAVAVAGSNETMLPLVNLVLLAGVVGSWSFRHPSRWVWTVALAASLAGSAAVALAPGNALRAAHFQRPSLAGCLGLCTWASVRFALKWSIRPMLLGLSILAVPVAARLVARSTWASRVRPRHVAMAVAGTLGLVFLTFAPAYVSMGYKPPLRSLNVSYFLFLVGWFTTLGLAVACWSNRRGVAPAIGPRAMIWGQVAVAAGLLMVGNLPRAVYDVVLVAPAYDRQLQARYASLEAERPSAAECVVVERLSARPKTLCFYELEENAAMNESFAQCFGVHSVAVAAAAVKR